jgi:phage shock protein E
MAGLSYGRLKRTKAPVKSPFGHHYPPSMKLSTWIILGVAIVAFLIYKRLTLMRPDTARDWLNKGARVIDVRSEGEYQEKHLPGALNIPLNRLRDEIARFAPGKEQPLLLHCLSGTRSGMGTAILKKMGYRNVFNLGSYGRAEKILAAQSQAGKKD